MKRFKFAASVTACLVVVTALWANVSYVKSRRVTDPWLREIPEGLSSEQFKYVAASKVHDVLLPMRSHANQQLKREPAVEISLKQAQTFVGKQIKLTPREKIYLVRGVDPFNDEGRYSVFQRGNNLLVISAALAKSISTPIHEPIVVCLETRPQSVFISYSLAE